jgi:hypothetical protein
MALSGDYIRHDEAIDLIVNHCVLNLLIHLFQHDFDYHNHSIAIGK